MGEGFVGPSLYAIVPEDTEHLRRWRCQKDIRKAALRPSCGSWDLDPITKSFLRRIWRRPTENLKKPLGTSPQNSPGLSGDSLKRRKYSLVFAWLGTHAARTLMPWMNWGTTGKLRG